MSTPTTNLAVLKGKENPTPSLGSISVTDVVNLDTNLMSAQRGGKST